MEQELISKSLFRGHRAKRNPGDEYDEAGLLCCGVCHKRKEVRVESKYFGTWIAPCMCDCEVETYQQQRAEKEQEQRRMRIQQLKDACFARSEMQCWIFDVAEGMGRKEMQQCKKYADNFPRMLANGQGLILWGDVGTGKTYAASCIANRVMESGYSCIPTSISRLVQASQAMDYKKQEYLERVNLSDLLLLDDLGTERESSYMEEQLFNIIDSRYRSGKPLIITTNLSLREMAEEQGDKRRVYDRVLQMCYPIHFDGENKRRKETARRFAEMAAFFGDTEQEA